MSAGVAMIALLASTQIIAILNPDSEVELLGRVVRVADVARLSGGDRVVRSDMAQRAIARLPSGRNVMALSRTALANLMARAVPGLRTVFAGEGEIRLRIPLPPSNPNLDAGCFALSNNVARGVPVTSDDAEPVACDPEATPASIVFDRGASLARAGRDLEAGSYLGRVALPRVRGVDRGDQLTLTAIVGPVRIEREVIALQPARPGHRVFVRSADGETISAPLPRSDEGRTP